MAGKGAAAGGAGIVTVLVVGIVGFFGGRPADNSADNENTPVNVGVTDNASNNGGGAATTPLPGLEDINGLISAVSLYAENMARDPAVMPTTLQLQQVFSGTPERLAAIDGQMMRELRGQLNLCKELMEREGYPLDRANTYETPLGKLTLEAGADGGLRVALK